MDEKICELTNEAIESGFQELKACRPGSEEQMAVMRNLTQLHAMAVEEAKIKQAEIGQKREDEFRNQQMMVEAKSRRNSTLWNAGLTVGGWLGTVALVVFAYKFEESGVVRSAVTRTLIPKMFLKTK